MLLMTVTNPVAEDLDTENLKTTKADKKLHGFGISTMENIAKKYNGDVSVSCEDKLFKAVISLYDNKI
ncbi:MAG: GHKL domain-containing protein, partial [Clostridia bacterium]|nr:GHKL domain-containing protein [Clostridia bacterium]